MIYKIQAATPATTAAKPLRVAPTFEAAPVYGVIEVVDARAPVVVAAVVPLEPAVGCGTYAAVPVVVMRVSEPPI